MDVTICAMDDALFPTVYADVRAVIMITSTFLHGYVNAKRPYVCRYTWVHVSSLQSNCYYLNVYLAAFIFLFGHSLTLLLFVFLPLLSIHRTPPVNAIAFSRALQRGDILRNMKGNYSPCYTHTCCYTLHKTSAFTQDACINRRMPLCGDGYWQ